MSIKVLDDVKDGIGGLALNRPDARNFAMHERLRAVGAGMPTDATVESLPITNLAGHAAPTIRLAGEKLRRNAAARLPNRDLGALRCIGWDVCEGGALLSVRKPEWSGT